MEYKDPPSENKDYWPVFTAYENGKARRYGHLFAVNGGAFALVGFLSPRYSGDSLLALLFGAWAFIVVPALLGLFTWYMCRDIDSFGRGMRVIAGYPENSRLKEGIYRQDGRDLLSRVQKIFTVGWLIAVAIGIIDSAARLYRLVT
jgi:hypothetical protein